MSEREQKNVDETIRGLKLKVSCGPHVTESKVWRAALKNIFFWIISNIFEKIDQTAQYFFGNLHLS
jgi:hypothetical protein